VWTGPAPRPALGGLFLGLATAEHPLVLFLLPGFGAFAMQGSLRQALGEDQRYLRRVWAGFLVGILAIFLPMLDASNTGLVHASAPHSPFAAIGAWLRGQDGACWSFTSPKHWPAGVSRLAVDLWHNAGPLGLLLGLAGLRSFFRGDARRARPFLLAHAPLALALVFGRADDAGMAAVLVSWTFLFWTTPALAALEDRLAGGVDGRAALRAPAVALLSAGILFALNAATIDHSREKGVSWTSTVLDTLPQDAVLVTRNPVALALSADGRRPDVDVVHVDEPSTLTAYHTGRLLLPLGDNPPAHVDPATLRKLVESTENAHGVFLDASVFFDTSLRTGLLGNEWIAVPHGLAFRVAEPSLRPSNDDLRAAALAWDGVNVAPDTPASPLRDGLTGSAYFARSLVQSAYLHLEQGRADDAEREFLLALGHPGVNRTLAAMGYARLMHQRHNWHEAESTLEDYVRDDDDGAWVARRFQGATLMRLGDRRRAVLMLQRALRLLPPDAKEERTTIQRELRSLQTPRPETPSGASETG
jgi:hypothetical protein